MRVMEFLCRLWSKKNQSTSEVKECYSKSELKDCLGTVTEYPEYPDTKQKEGAVMCKANVFWSKEKKEWNQLHTAARDGDVTKIESLLLLGICIDSRESTDKTPLMIAAFNGKLQAVRYLTEEGADPSLADNNGWNSLHFASQGGDPNIIDLIVSHVPDIELRTGEGFTPLMIAASNGKEKAVKYLLKKGADPFSEDNNRWISLHHASQGGSPDVIDLMLSQFIDIESKTGRGETPLMIAVINGKLQAVTCLLEKGADPSLRDKKSWNSLHYAARGNNPNVIELILNHMPVIESRTAQDYTPLMIAAGNGKVQIVTFLLEKGADPSLQDSSGYNSLHWASRSDKPVIIEKILSRGGDIESESKSSWETPLMIAQDDGHFKALTYLRSKGAKCY